MASCSFSVLTPQETIMFNMILPQQLTSPQTRSNENNNLKKSIHVLLYSASSWFVTNGGV